MEEVHMAKYGAWHFHPSQRVPISPNLHLFTDREASSLNTVLFSSYGGFMKYTWLIKTLATGD